MQNGHRKELGKVLPVSEPLICRLSCSIESPPVYGSADVLSVGQVVSGSRMWKRKTYTGLCRGAEIKLSFDSIT